MDIKTVQGRFKHEGLSFLTIALPEFGKDFQKGLDQGWVDRHLFIGFRRKGGLPRFLGGFLDRVFDRSSGLLLDEPDIDAILAVRQLTLFYGKISLPCSDARVRRAMSDFINCEKDLRVNDARLSKADRLDFERVSSLLFSRVFTAIDKSIYNFEAIPKHGPGTTAEGITGNRKYNQLTWTARLESILPSGEMLLPNWRFRDSLERVEILEPGDERPVRVVHVPKTLKAPRIIGIEPVAMQYAQQSILPLILDGLTRDDSLARIIGFDDQTPNQRMAQKGSQDGTLATLDLSEASDRVSNQHVRSMFHRWPYLHAAIDASRSRKAEVPGHSVIRLAKFASMGSALCFPVEAMVFTTLIFMGIEKELSRPLRRKDVRILSDKVRVYGDDLIIPADYVHSVVVALEAFGFQVNYSKSFWTGRFRESCGKEFYAGHDVSIVKARQVFPTQRKHATEIISLISLRNQLYFAGYWETVKWLDETIIGIIRYFPVVAPTSSVQGRHSFLGYEVQRTGERLHNPLVRGYTVSASPPPDVLDDVGALLKFFLKRGGLPSVDGRHLERAGRPKSVSIKLGMASPF